MPATRPLDDLITINQAAELLGVHHKTLRNWIRNGKLPAHRVGDWGIRVHQADLRAVVRPIAAVNGSGK